MPADRPEGFPLIAVPDTAVALWSLAARWRTELEARVVAITGSAGKTTLRKLLQAVCEADGATTASRRSFNNHIGVPLSVLSADRSDRYLILELGTNAPGEIRALAELARPELGVITSIGSAHLEGLGSREGIALEKGALFEVLPPGGTAILPEDSPFAATLAGRCPNGVGRVGFGAQHGSVRIAERHPLGPGGEQSIRLEDGLELRTRLPGCHNALNVCAAVAAARALGIADEPIAGALSTVDPDPMRGAPLILEATGTLLLNDVYNANPEAVHAALEAFAELAADAPRRMVVLGDMLELGEGEAALHAEAGRAVADLDRRHPIDVAVFIGPRSRHGAEALHGEGFSRLLVYLPGLDDDLADAVSAMIQPGDAVLLKGSRGMALERIVEAARVRADRSAKELVGR